VVTHIGRQLWKKGGISWCLRRPGSVCRNFAAAGMIKADGKMVIAVCKGSEIAFIDVREWCGGARTSTETRPSRSARTYELTGAIDLRVNFAQVL